MVTRNVSWRTHTCHATSPCHLMSVLLLCNIQGLQTFNLYWNLNHDSTCYSCDMLEASLLWYQRNSNPQVLDGIYTMISPVTVVIYSKRHYYGTSGIQTYKFWIKLRQISTQLIKATLISINAFPYYAKDGYLNSGSICHF